MPPLINGKTQSAINQVYIGRKMEGMHFGNPFSHLRRDSKTTATYITVGSREEAVLSFELWITGEAFQDVEPERREWILQNLHTLRGKPLVCYCAPLKCHGEILLKMANE